jgi:hypothetical protein
MADALRAMIAAGGDPYGNSRELMLKAISVLRHAGVEAGVVRPDIAPPDVLAMLTGTALAAGRPEQRKQAERLLDFTLDAMSTGAGEPPRQPAAPAAPPDNAGGWQAPEGTRS